MGATAPPMEAKTAHHPLGQGFRNGLLGKMGDVAREGRTLLFVSHNMNAVERLCGRVIHLESESIAGTFQDVRQGIDVS